MSTVRMNTVGFVYEEIVVTINLNFLDKKLFTEYSESIVEITRK